VPYKLVIFDFDGTLADSFPWFVGVVNAVADRYGFKRIDESEIETLRGYGARQLIGHLGLPSWKLPLVARHMRALAGEHADRIRLFEGAARMLRRLADNGLVLAIVTSNSQENVRRVLGPENAALIDHYACGASMFGKAAKLRKVLKASAVAREQALCIGDEIRDHEAARRENLAGATRSWRRFERIRPRWCSRAWTRWPTGLPRSKLPGPCRIHDRPLARRALRPWRFRPADVQPYRPRRPEAP
jgi:phosphoglycolate phosphatase